MDAYKQEKSAAQTALAASLRPMLLSALIGALWGAAVLLSFNGSDPFLRPYLALPPIPVGLGLLALFCVQDKPARCAGIAAAAAAVVALVIGRAEWPAGLLLSLLVPAASLLIAEFQRRKLGGFLTAAAAAASVITLLYATVCLPPLLRGAGAFAGIEAYVTDLTALFEESFAPLRAYPELTRMVELYETIFASLPAAVPLMAASVICSLGGICALLGVVLFFALTRRKRETLGLRAPKPFRLWTVPRTYLGGFMLLYLLTFVLELIGLDSAQAVYNTVSALLGLPLTVQALSLIAYLLMRRKHPARSLNAVVFVAIGLLYPLAEQMLVTVGLFDLLLRIRERTFPPAPRGNA